MRRDPLFFFFSFVLLLSRHNLYTRKRQVPFRTGGEGEDEEHRTPEGIYYLCLWAVRLSVDGTGIKHKHTHLWTVV